MSGVNGSDKRYPAIDYIRGICIILMILDHVLFFSIKFQSELWGGGGYNAIQRFILTVSSLAFDSEYYIIRNVLRTAVLSLFFIISGMCCSLSRNNLKRSLKMFICALCITAVTAILSFALKTDLLIVWGILHCYSVCIFIYWIFQKIERPYFITLLIIFMAAHIVINSLEPTLDSSVLLVPLGIPPKDFSYPIEYFPILNWVGIFFIGVTLGKYFLTEKRKKKPKESGKFAQWYARHSIVIKIGRRGATVYFLHFPITALFLYSLNLF